MLQPIWLPVCIITVATTVIVMAVTGRVTQAIIPGSRKRKRKESRRKSVYKFSILWRLQSVLSAYEVGLLLRKKFKKAIFSPLLIGILCVIGVLSIFHIEYDSYNVGGQYVSYLLTPALSSSGCSAL